MRKYTHTDVHTCSECVCVCVILTSSSLGGDGFGRKAAGVATRAGSSEL